MDANDITIGLSPSADSFDVDAEFENVFLRDDSAMADGDAQDPLDRLDVLPASPSVKPAAAADGAGRGTSGGGSASASASMLLPSPGSLPPTML